jgi:hypothetical protein
MSSRSSVFVLNDSSISTAQRMIGSSSLPVPSRAESCITSELGGGPNPQNYGVVSFGTPVLIDGGGVRPHLVFGLDRRVTLNEPPAVISLPVIHGLT